MSEFAQHVLAAVRDEATRRNMRGARPKVLRFVLGHMTPSERHRTLGRNTLSSVMTAVTEAAEGFSAIERQRFELHHEVPEWFWEWVDARATWWDENV